MLKFKIPALLFGLMALCAVLACNKTSEPAPNGTDNALIIPVRVNGVVSNFKVEAYLLKDSNTMSVYFEYLTSSRPNFTVSINSIPNQTGTYKIAKSTYPSFETNGDLAIADGDAIYDFYPVFENESNSITISNLDTANKTITGDLKCTFVRENMNAKLHNYPDKLVIERNGFVLPYAVK